MDKVLTSIVTYATITNPWTSILIIERVLNIEKKYLVNKPDIKYIKGLRIKMVCVNHPSHFAYLFIDTLKWETTQNTRHTYDLPIVESCQPK